MLNLFPLSFVCLSLLELDQMFDLTIISLIENYEIVSPLHFIHRKGPTAFYGGVIFYFSFTIWHLMKIFAGFYELRKIFYSLFDSSVITFSAYKKQVVIMFNLATHHLCAEYYLHYYPHWGRCSTVIP